jgi:sec-independent protein translocase protein TatB
MFDIGFFELAVIGVVALLVIGPERLPGVARTTGLWFGRIRRFVGSVKEDIDREIKADELKRIIEQQEKSSGVHEILEETRGALDELEQTQVTLHEDVTKESASDSEERASRPRSNNES